MAEVPGVLRDARAGVAPAGAGAAAVVALERPERQGADALGDGPVVDLGGVGRGERLGRAVVVDARHLDDAGHAPQLGVGLRRVQVRQLALETRDRRLGVLGHVVRGAVVVVERHEVHDVDLGAVGHRVLQHRETAVGEAARGGGQGVRDLHRAPVGGRPVLDLLDRLVAAVDPGAVLQGVVLDVHIEAGHVVGRDDLLVRRRDGVDVRTAVGDLGAAVVGRVAAERRDHVAAARPDRGEVGAELGLGDGGARIAVPVGGAGTAGLRLDEGHGQVLGAGRLGERGRAVAVPRLEVRGEDVRGQGGGGGCGGLCAGA